MALFLFRGPPIYAGGVGENANILANVPVPSASITASALAPIVWGTIPDQVFIQNETASHNLSAYSNVAGGYPLRVTLAPSSAALPTGVTWDEATKTLIGTNPPNIVNVSGVKLRATSGVLGTLAETVAAPSGAVAATAGQPSPGVFAAINGQVARPSGTVSAEATQNPPPVGIGYPTTYTVPTDAEYIWSDTADGDFYTAHGSHDYSPTGVSHHVTWQVPTNVYANVYGHTAPHPGYYSYMQYDAACMWHNVGGDWADLNNVAQGTTTFRSVSVTAAPAHGTGAWKSWDIYNLVSLWLDRTFRNAGLWLRGSNTNVIIWASKYDIAVPDRKPYLMLTSTTLGQVRVECARNIWVSSSTETSMAENTVFQTSGSSMAGLLYFDLSAYSASDITAAVMWCYTTDQYGNQTVNVFRCVNPADQDGDHGTPIDTQHIGVAGNYPVDVGIENDPTVLFVQKFTDDAIQANGLRVFEDLSIPGSDAGNSGWQVTRAPDGNGFTPLAGIYNGGKATATTGGGPGCHWSPWRGHPVYTGPGGKRLKPYVELEEMYFRFYLMFGADWNPMPWSGKLLGFDGRYCTLTGSNPIAQPACPWVVGMSRGNSGSGTDGITGWSARSNFSRQPTPGSPMDSCRGLGMSDAYTADMTNAFGGNYPFRNHYLGMLRKAQWHCIELHCKMNSVTQPEEVPRKINQWTRSGTVATVFLDQPMNLTDPLYQVGVPWTFGGAYIYNGAPLWQGTHAITSIVDERTFTYTISSSASTTPGYGGGSDGNCGWWAVPSVGNFDGVLEGWINGRLADRYSGLRFRHTRLRNDGGLLGIDNAWFCMFDGGDPVWTEEPFSLYIANLVIGTSYIGPLVGYP